MATSFFGGAFFGGEFFSASTGAATGSGTAKTGGTYRYFTPLPSSKKRKQINAVLHTESRIKRQIEEYQDKGVDLAILSDLQAKLRELQILLLKLALESAEAQNYIGLKRMQEQEEFEDIQFIMKLL